MQKTISVKKAVLIALLASVLVGSVVAAVRYTLNISNTATITSIYGIELWVVTGTEFKITSINWGSIDPGTSKTTYDIYDKPLKVKNTGNMHVWVAWRLDSSTPLPSGVSLSCELNTLGEWTPLAENDFSKLSIDPGQYSEQYLRFVLTVAQSTTGQSFSFTIQLLAANSPTG